MASAGVRKPSSECRGVVLAGLHKIVQVKWLVTNEVALRSGWCARQQRRGWPWALAGGAAYGLARGTVLENTLFRPSRAARTQDGRST